MNKIRKKIPRPKEKEKVKGEGKLQVTLNNVVAIVTIIGALIAIYSQLPKPTRKVSTKYLKRIERKLESQYQSQALGKARFEDNKQHYFQENTALTKRLNEIKNAANANGNFASLTYVTAPAGSGKSWIGLGLCKSVLGKNVKIISLRNLFVRSNQATGIKVRKIADLTMRDSKQGKVTVSKMPYFRLDSIQQLFALTHISKERFVVIDDLDEVHPTVADNILKALEDHYCASEHKPISFIVFGRPEAYYAHLTHTHRTLLSRDVPMVALKTPIYRNKAELRVRYNNWAKRKLLADSLREKVFEMSLQYLAKYKYLVLSFKNAASSDKFYDYIQAMCTSGNASIRWSQEEAKMKHQLVDLALKRNQETHGRPEATGLLSNEYMAMLAKVAAHYTKSIDKDNGWFNVPSREELTVNMANNQTLKFNAREVLNRSGFINIKPVSSNAIHYKFEVFWMHRYFVDYYNNNLAKYN